MAQSSMGAPTTAPLNQIDHGQDPLAALKASTDAYRKALQMEPASLLIHANLISALATKAEYEMDHGIDPTKTIQESIDVFKRSASINRNHASVLRNMSNIYLIRGRYEMDTDSDPRPSFQLAMDLGATAQKVNPAVASNFYGACAYRYRAKYEREHGIDSHGSTDQAIQILESLATRNFPMSDSELSEAWIEKAERLHANKRSASDAFQEASTWIDRAIKTNPNDATAYFIRGKLDYLMSKSGSSVAGLKEALESIDHSLQLKPDLAEAYCLRAIVQIRSLEFEKDAKRGQAGFEEAKQMRERGIAINRFLAREYRAEI
jgi:eukaryotic-like serine/threonine-protein kinase